MSNTQYYYIISSLLDCYLTDSKPAVGLADLVSDLRDILAEEDFLMVEEILCGNDNGNIADVLAGFETPMMERTGNFTYDEVKAAVDAKNDIFADYINEFLEEYYKLKDDERPSRVQVERALNEAFYKKMIAHPNPFLSQYFEFDLTLRNVLVALNRKKFKFDDSAFVALEQDLYGHELSTSQAGDFGLTGKVEHLSEIIEHFTEEKITDCEFFIDKVRYEKIDEINRFSYFDIDMILGYLIKTLLSQRWISLTEENGGQVFDERIRFEPEKLQSN